MNKLLRTANDCKAQMTLVDLGLLSACFLFLGVLLGLAVPKKHKKRVAVGTGVVCSCAYAPLITKFFTVVLKQADGKGRAKA